MNEKKLIDAQDAVRLLRGKCVAKYPNSFLLGLLAAASEIEGMPEAEPVKHGRWEKKYHKNPLGDYHRLHCSECGEDKPSAIHTNYCPNCGAKMDWGD